MKHSLCGDHAAALKDTLQDPPVMAKMNDGGFTPGYLGGAERAAVNLREIEIWKRVAGEASITLD